MTRRRAFALHEATHAVIAQKMGLTVSWVSIDSGHAEGIHFTAAVQIPDETIDWERDRLAILVAMAAPAFMETFDKEVNRYSRLEEQTAYQVARLHDLDTAEIFDKADSLVDEHKAEIVDLAEQLVKAGKVVFG